MQLRFSVFLIFALALAIGGQSAVAGAADNSAIFANDFGGESDTNYDQWPDYWERITGAAYPHYTRVEIQEDKSAKNGRSLHINFDGGGAHVSTPLIPILPKFGYKLIVRAKALGLDHTEARVSMELQTRGGEALEEKRSDPIKPTGKWQNIQLGPFRPADPRANRAVIRITAPRGRRGDLNAHLWIDSIVLQRLPNMTVTTGRAYNIYDDFKEVKVECTLSGIHEQNPEIRFQLLDETRRIIQGKATTNELHGRLIVEDTLNAADIVGRIGTRHGGYEGTTYWTPDIDDYGFYRIRVEMLREGVPASDQPASEYDRQLGMREITLAVLPKLPRPASGEFGWTLPVGDKPLSFDVLTDLLPRVGVHWVKLPVWYPQDNRDRGEEIVRFAERTSAAGIQVVGILDKPHEEDDLHRDPNAPTDVADLLLSDASFWQPQFEHVLTRLSLRLRWWQLGNDWDTSFYGCTDLASKLSKIRKHLFRFGQDVKLGIGWRWPEQDKEDEWSEIRADSVAEYLQMSSHPAPTAEELEHRMRTTPRTAAQRWVLVDPTVSWPADKAVEELSADEQQKLHEDHVQNFVQQMIGAKMHGADAVFVANPFTGPEGVMNIDGTPGELLLPWRTTAHLLGGASYLGQLELPGGSTNRVFSNRDGNVLMVVWNDRPTRERLYLGESVERIDVWGKRTSLTPDAEGRVTLDVDRRPSFVTGLDPAVTRWRMAISFDHLLVPSVFSRSHENVVRGVNHFSQGVNGKFVIRIPRDEDENPLLAHHGEWKIIPSEGNFSLGAQETYQLPFQIMLNEATCGPQPVRIDFEVDAQRRYQFSAWRTLNVGLDDVHISIKTHLNDSGQLVVEQEMVNTGLHDADFKCLLYAPPRRRKRTQVVSLSADGNRKIYKYENGEELLGNVLKLRAEEINGSRVLVHRFVAERGDPSGTAASELPAADDEL